MYRFFLLSSLCPAVFTVHATWGTLKKRLRLPHYGFSSVVFVGLLVSFQTHISNLPIRLDFVIGGNKTLKKLMKNKNLNVPITLTTASRNKLI